MNINDIKQFKAGFDEVYGRPLPRGWLLMVIVKATFMASILYEFITSFK